MVKLSREPSGESGVSSPNRKFVGRDGGRVRLVIENISREMWALEYEVDELQLKFSDSIGKMDLDNLDVDFIEDMMLKAKPLQTVLNCIRDRQIVSF